MSPGPIADQAFETGFKLAALLGFVGGGLLYVFDVLSLTNEMHVATTVLLFPVYLLLVAVLLGVWLGYETDERDLEQVTEPVEMTAHPWDRWR